MLSTRRRVLQAGLATVATGACHPRAPQARRLPVVTASFSILADIAQTLVGDAALVQSLVGPNTSLHHFEASPRALETIKGSSLVIENGLGLEGWMSRLPETVGFRGQVSVASENITPILLSGAVPDPHAWQSFANISAYARTIADELSTALPKASSQINSNLMMFERQTSLAKAKADALLEPFRDKNVILLVPHNSFRYFGAEFGLAFRGIASMSTGSQPSAAGIARLVEDLKQSKGAACFVENVAETQFIEQIARETKTKVGGRLYSDALSDKSGPASNILDLLHYNAATISKALAS